ncbi:MAG: hypothetical protein EPO68_05975 [Planctomycetota bacterium]|nr:MAG: hypothetical protein EPO68_05975 [Planctomycetota bacterium]
MSTHSALLGVDEAGQHLLACGNELVLGHARGRDIDLPFLANLPPRHACFQLRQSFLGGAEWHIVPLSDEPVLRNGRAVERRGAQLRDHDHLELATNLELSFHLPDPSTSSALLIVRRGPDCAGANRLLLVAPGPGGRVRVGATPQRHVRVPNLRGDCALAWNGEELELASELGIALRGAERLQEARAQCALPFPPRARTDLALGASAGAQPALWLTLEPLLHDE